MKRTALKRRTQMERKPSRLKKTPLGHCTDEQKERVAGYACIVCGKHVDECEPMHVVDRGHPKMTEDAANDVRAVVPGCHWCHLEVHEGKVELLAYLEPDWRNSQEWAAGAIGLASAYRALTEVNQQSNGGTTCL